MFYIVKVTKLDGMTEKAKARLEKAQRRAEEQTKRFGCIVEMVQQLSCSREIEDLEQDLKATSNKDDANAVTTSKNIFEAVDEEGSYDDFKVLMTDHQFKPFV